MKHIPFLLAFLLSCGIVAAQFTQHVDPFIGTGGHGHTFPGPVMPFGMIQPGPDTRLEGWDGCSGYHYSDDVIYGFSHTHLSGTGVPDYCDILVMPTTGDVEWDNGATGGPETGYSSRFRKSTERATPGYYCVVLDDYSVNAEITCTERAAMHAYHWPQTIPSSNIILDLTHRDKTIESWIKVVNDSTVEGMRRSKGWADDQYVYFVMEFSQSFKTWSVNNGGTVKEMEKEASSNSLKAAFRFDLSRGNQIRVRIGISAVDAAGARNNLHTEMPHWDFEKYRTKANDAWNKALGKIVVEGSVDADKKVFYTALYHCMIHPSLYSDADGRYRGRDLKIHQLAAGEKHYTVFSLWDTYRALHPLFTLIEQERTRDFIGTFVRQYQEGGRLPVWELAGNETDCMIGYHSVSVIADAWMKGIRPGEPSVVLNAMMHSAYEDRFGAAQYGANGYLSSSDVSESVSRVLEYAYDDWCIAQVAGSLGRKDVQADMLRRSQAWRSHYDPSSGFMRARTNGGWWSPFEPREVNFNYTEANAWQYSLSVPQDIPGMVRMHGGPGKFRAHLDQLFSAPSLTTGREQSDITGLIGQYAHGNEPSHHIAYLYNYTDTPWMSRFMVRRIMNEMYSVLPDGLSGNEDCGQMSAWFVLSSLGIYPLTPGDPNWTLGMPLFNSSTIHFESGEKFVIRQNRTAQRTDAVFLASIQLNGKPWPMLTLPHSVLTKGGDVMLVLTDKTDGEGKWVASPQPELPWVGRPGAVSPAPVISAASRSFTDALEIDITCIGTDCQKLWVSTNEGSTWDTIVAASFHTFIKETTTYWVKAQQLGCAPSGVVKATYFKRNAGLTLHLDAAYAPEYTAGGDDALIDGIRGGPDFRTGDWQGYRGDLSATADLGKAQRISSIQLSCLQDIRSWIWMPQEVVIEVSKNGKTWKPAGAPVHPVTDLKAEGSHTEEIGLKGLNLKARYVRVRASQLGTIPEWHLGAGGKSWIFADEIIIRY